MAQQNNALNSSIDDSHQIAISLLGTLVNGVATHKYQNDEALEQLFDDAIANANTGQELSQKPNTKTTIERRALSHYLVESARTLGQAQQTANNPNSPFLFTKLITALIDPYVTTAQNNWRYWQQLTTLSGNSYYHLIENMSKLYSSTQDTRQAQQKQRLLRLIGAYLLYKRASTIAQKKSLTDSRWQAKKRAKLVEVANLGKRLITAVAVANDGRLFVNFPHWYEPFKQPSVALLNTAAELTPYPNEAWNNWQPGQATQYKFVSVQSVHIDHNNQLWILDTGAPYFGKTIVGAAKLVQVDLATREVVRIIRFDPNLASADSYLNDVRIDPAGTHAYVTDSRLGHLLVIDLLTNRVRILLRNHSSSKAEPHVSATVEGHRLRLPDGQLFQPHCDGIALFNGYLYYRAVTSNTLYRIKTEQLKNTWLVADQLHQSIEIYAKAGICDGMCADQYGNIYLTALGNNAIERITPVGELETVVQDTHLQWPDSLAIGPDRYLYIAVSQLHLIPFFHRGKDQRRNPHRIFKIKI